MAMDMNRYRTDEDFRKRFIDYIKKYHKTKKGKIAKKRAEKKFTKRGYYATYLKERREKAKKEGVCPRCYKNKARTNKIYCKKCISYGKAYYRRNL